jgi:hypothetical protein
MAAKTMSFSSVRAEEHVISEANGRQSREQIVLSSPGADILAGTVLGKITATGEYVPLAIGAATGAETAAAIQCVTEIALSPVGDIRTSAHVRDCEVNGWKLQWPAGILDADKATAEAELAENGILVRY